MLDGVCAATEQRAKNAASELQALRKEMQRKQPSTEKLKKAIAERAKKIGGLQKRINEIEDRIFAAFSQKVRQSFTDAQVQFPSQTSCIVLLRLSQMTQCVCISGWRRQHSRVHGETCSRNRGTD